MDTIKRHGSWRSATVAEKYIENSINYKKKTGDLITASITGTSSDTSASSTSASRKSTTATSASSKSATATSTSVAFTSERSVSDASVSSDSILDSASIPDAFFNLENEFDLGSYSVNQTEKNENTTNVVSQTFNNNPLTLNGFPPEFTFIKECKDCTFNIYFKK